MPLKQHHPRSVGQGFPQPCELAFISNYPSSIRRRDDTGEGILMQELKLLNFQAHARIQPNTATPPTRTVLPSYASSSTGILSPSNCGTPVTSPSFPYPKRIISTSTLITPRPAQLSNFAAGLLPPSCFASDQCKLLQTFELCGVQYIYFSIFGLCTSDSSAAAKPFFGPVYHGTTFQSETIELRTARTRPSLLARMLRLSGICNGELNCDLGGFRPEKYCMRSRILMRLGVKIVELRRWLAVCLGLLLRFTAHRSAISVA
ncbi:uncharacterized protein BDR25DRAFT_367906 [Lindgomyces ingoldianus]|uniref:Uncharacterized protein n=1 Tax=Lindgomyces ingoldianus TaxID=673940 RepID=A0ACB6QXD6_9PLEO|nr:uncharacterized protein BDR25DRAFT_367906 [Lindgomyces ingoldianus]KAF2471175.1 hypothetical protein BDR25DRAFT_367906 [Lindgomyces ingoldianus]